MSIQSASEFKRLTYGSRTATVCRNPAEQTVRSRARPCDRSGHDLIAVRETSRNSAESTCFLQSRQPELNVKL